MYRSTIAVCVAVVGLAVGYGVFHAASAEESRSAKKDLLSFVRIGATDTMVINASVQGCGGGNRYRLEYTPVPSPRITVYTDGGTTEKNWNLPLPRVGVVTLTPAQVQRLDNRFHYWRSKHSIGSTTHEAITVTAFHAGQPIGTEKYTDFTGSIDTFDDADPRDITALKERDKSFTAPRPVLSLYRIFEIAEQSGKRNTPLPYRDITREKTQAFKRAAEQKQYAP